MDAQATQATGDLVGMLLSGGGGTLGGAARTLLLRLLGSRGDRNGGGDRLRALEGQRPEVNLSRQTGRLYRH
jgi:hypothetical protein